jgi:probable HAF family extracellular repeat protein
MNRNYHRTFFLAFCAVCIATLSVSSVHGVSPQYTITDLGSLGGTITDAQGINSSGQVTGQSFTAGNSASRAYFYDGTIHNLGTLGGNSSYGGDINDNGMIAGTSSKSELFPYPYHAFLYDGTTMHDLGTLGGTYSEGHGINSSGWVTGHARNAGEKANAFLYDGTMHNLGTLGGDFSGGYSINDSGRVVGESHLAGNSVYRAFLYDGAMHDLGTLGGSNSSAWDINNNGLITGWADTPSGVERAFFYDGTMHNIGTLPGGNYSRGSSISNNGKIVGTSTINTGGTGVFHAFLYDGISGMVDLNNLIFPGSGWVLNEANGINDSGQIVGIGKFGNQDRGFLLTPIPEPSSILLVSAFLAALGFAVKQNPSLDF